MRHPIMREEGQDRGVCGGHRLRDDGCRAYHPRPGGVCGVRRAVHSICGPLRSGDQRQVFGGDRTCPGQAVAVFRRFGSAWLKVPADGEIPWRAPCSFLFSFLRYEISRCFIAQQTDTRKVGMKKQIIYPENMSVAVMMPHPQGRERGR